MLKIALEKITGFSLAIQYYDMSIKYGQVATSSEMAGLDSARFRDLERLYLDRFLIVFKSIF